MRQSASTKFKSRDTRENKTVSANGGFKPLMGDSLEVMSLYYEERIVAFSEMLQHLNILEDASEIEFLCREITAARKALNKIHLKKNFTA
jgi:hypothetical protein